LHYLVREIVFLAGKRQGILMSDVCGNHGPAHVTFGSAARYFFLCYPEMLAIAESNENNQFPDNDFSIGRDKLHCTSFTIRLSGKVFISFLSQTYMILVVS